MSHLSIYGAFITKGNICHSEKTQSWIGWSVSSATRNISFNSEKLIFFWVNRSGRVYLFSLALCLKSSTAFLKRVTLNRPLSLSSNSSLEMRTECTRGVGKYINTAEYLYLWSNNATTQRCNTFIFKCKFNV